MSNISRSVYQKVCEENKKMRHDLMILAFGVGDDGVSFSQWLETKIKWVKIFEQERHFRKILKDAALKYLDEHPELREKYPTLFPLKEETHGTEDRVQEGREDNNGQQT